MSDQAENAALQQVVDGYKAAKDAKAKYEGRLRTLADELVNFATALKAPDSYCFMADINAITVGTSGGNATRPFVRLTPTDLNWNDLCDALHGYVDASRDKKEGAARLRDMGLPVSD